VGVKKIKKFLEVGNTSSFLRHEYLRRVIAIVVCEKMFLLDMILINLKR
jgi:hypothetical protein